METKVEFKMDIAAPLDYSTDALMKRVPGAKILGIRESSAQSQWPELHVEIPFSSARALMSWYEGDADDYTLEEWIDTFAVNV